VCSSTVVAEAVGATELLLLLLLLLGASVTRVTVDYTGLTPITNANNELLNAEPKYSQQ
jgi:hypothetical protein